MAANRLILVFAITWTREHNLCFNTVQSAWLAQQARARWAAGSCWNCVFATSRDSEPKLETSKMSTKEDNRQWSKPQTVAQRVSHWLYYLWNHRLSVINCKINLNLNYNLLTCVHVSEMSTLRRDSCWKKWIYYSSTNKAVVKNTSLRFEIRCCCLFTALHTNSSYAITNRIFRNMHV